MEVTQSLLDSWTPGGLGGAVSSNYGKLFKNNILLYYETGTGTVLTVVKQFLYEGEYTSIYLLIHF